MLIILYMSLKERKMKFDLQLKFFVSLLKIIKIVLIVSLIIKYDYEVFKY